MTTAWRHPKIGRLLAPRRLKVLILTCSDSIAVLAIGLRGVVRRNRLMAWFHASVRPAFARTTWWFKKVVPRFFFRAAVLLPCFGLLLVGNPAVAQGGVYQLNYF